MWATGPVAPPAASTGLFQCFPAPHIQRGPGDADKLVCMRFRSSMLMILSLVLALNGAGIGNANAHPAAPGHTHITVHEHSMSSEEQPDCLGHGHELETAADSIGGHEDRPDSDDSGGDRCKTPLCGCGCVGTNASVMPTKAGLATAVVHGFVVPTDVAIYDSPVLRHLIRPPILRALHAP